MNILYCNDGVPPSGCGDGVPPSGCGDGVPPSKSSGGIHAIVMIINHFQHIG